MYFALQVPQKITILSEPATYQSKLSKTPSMRAITNYYNMSTDNDPNSTYDNLSFIPEDNRSSSRYDHQPYNISHRVPNDYYNFSSNASTLNKDISLRLMRADAGSEGAPRPYGTSEDDYDYAMFGTVGSSSARTYVSGGSEPGSERRDDLGSTSQLVPTKVKSVSHDVLFLGHEIPRVNRVPAGGSELLKITAISGDLFRFTYCW